MLIIYGLDDCPTCDNCQKFCQLYDMEFEFRVIKTIQEKEDLLTKMGFQGGCNLRLPQGFVDNKWIGGFRGIKDYVYAAKNNGRNRRQSYKNSSA